MGVETIATHSGPAPGAAEGERAPGASTDHSRTPLERYREVRHRTKSLCQPLATEDYVVQTMEDVSPTKWHLAHVSWFFETFLLQPHLPDYESIDPVYAYLFNSYYVQAGERHCRDRRGYISRPTVAQVYDYRAHVDEHMARLLENGGAESPEVMALLETGLNHEQQHQELLLTDIKHVFSVNPLRPAYQRAAEDAADRRTPALEWVAFGEGVYEIGHEGGGFAFDNEEPRHRHYLNGFEIADRLVTNGEFLEFMRDGGYERSELWLSEGWAAVLENEWSEPFYWEPGDEAGWKLFTLAGTLDVDPREPVCHLSYFEADAFARWAGARLPTEQEWEVAVRGRPIRGNFVDSGRFHPAPLASEPDGRDSEGEGAGSAASSAAAGDPDSAGGRPNAGPLHQFYGDVWEWTRSQYSPYPGYEPPPGAIGEYNGKFMSNQFVLRGGSCATSRSHIRPTYRNFFPADACWQFSGLRLAKDA